MKTKPETWKCDQCGYKTTFNVILEPGKLPDILSVCGIAGPQGNCKGNLRLIKEK